MSLAREQLFLARLYTDAAVRRRFFDCPLEAAREHGLTTEEARRLASIARDRVELFADSLAHKRLRGVSELLPLTRRILGDAFARLFRRYAEGHRPRGPRKIHEDALCFARYLVELEEPPSVFEQPWVAELVRYEALWVRATDPRFRVQVSWFGYRMDEVASRVTSGAEVTEPSKQRCLACWWRWRSAPVRLRILSVGRLRRF